MLTITTQYSEEYRTIRTDEHIRWEPLSLTYHVMPWFKGSLATAKDLAECIRDHIEFFEYGARDVIVNVELTDKYPEGDIIEYDLETVQDWYKKGEFSMAHYNRAD